MIDTDHEYMALALRLAERGRYSAHPNPRVGCVLVKDGVVVGEGWHHRAGEPHAEINALHQAGERARGATAYVTLEPCCHTGRTPPCTDALIAAGVRRVVAAMPDPNPLVASQGLKQLTQAGIEITSGVLQAQAEALNPGFIMRILHQRPWVRCKLAMSLDGRTALANGRSQWITGPEARADVQRLRAQSSAIMTGIGTVLADDPSLTARSEQLIVASLMPGENAAQNTLRQPLRVVLDSRLRMPKQARMLGLPGHTLIITGQSASHPEQLAKCEAATVVSMPGGKNGLNLPEILRFLATMHEINDLLLEAGPTLSGAMLQAGLIDELVLYVAPMLLGDSARGLFRLFPALQDLQQGIDLDITDIRAVGDDWRIRARIVRAKP
jgi:diaminohydroxyphosphoribosylaminopyrimidine deaminase/5-amino-6-(5-phosphoribosylamino)uracil reductase